MQLAEQFHSSRKQELRDLHDIAILQYQIQSHLRHILDSRSRPKENVAIEKAIRTLESTTMSLQELFSSIVKPLRLSEFVLRVYNLSDEGVFSPARVRKAWENFVRSYQDDPGKMVEQLVKTMDRIHTKQSLIDPHILIDLLERYNFEHLEDTWDFVFPLFLDPSKPYCMSFSDTLGIYITLFVCFPLFLSFSLSFFQVFCVSHSHVDACTPLSDEREIVGQRGDPKTSRVCDAVVAGGVG